MVSDNLFTILTFSRSRHLCAKSLGLKRLQITELPRHYQVLAPDCRKQREQRFIGRLIMQSVSTGDKPSLACVAGVQKGRERELRRETAREGGGRRVPFLSPSRAPKFPLTLPLLTPATQAKLSQTSLERSIGRRTRSVCQKPHLFRPSLANGADIAMNSLEWMKLVGMLVVSFRISVSLRVFWAKRHHF